MFRNKNYLKIVSLCIVAMLGISCFAGCSPKNPSSDPSNPDASTGESAGESGTDSSDGTGEPGSSSDGTNSDGTSNPGSGDNGIVGGDGYDGGDASFKEPIYDLGGRVITIAWEGAPPDMSKKTIFNDSITLTQKKYNCTFKFVQKSDYNGLYQVLINDHSAGVATYDAVMLRGYDVAPNIANSGAVLDLSKHYDFKSDPTWNEAVFKGVGDFKGGKYGLAFSPNEMGSGIWYNRALLRKHNVPDLWTYVESNKWTWNTFRSVCKQLTKDTNGDGKIDEWGFTSEDPWLAFVSSNNASLMTASANAAPKFSLNSKNALEALDFVNTMFSDNTIPDGKELGLITSSPFNAMTTGKVAMFNYQARYGTVLKQFNIPTADIGWVYMPKGPAATEYSSQTGTMPDMFVVPTAAKQPKELIAAIQDLCAYWDTSREIKQKVTDKTDELANMLSSTLDANAKKVLYLQATKPIYNYASCYNITHELQNKLWPSILKGSSPKQAVDTVAKEIQTKINTLYSGKTVG